MLKADTIVNLLREGEASNFKDELDDPLVITPYFGLDEFAESNSASIDLRLGTWFLTLRQSRTANLEVNQQQLDGRESTTKTVSQQQLDSKAFTFQPTRSNYVPFGSAYILHPQSFVLGVTLEWMSMPANLGGYVTAKSGWGRRGLIIATATGVHPGFKGCLTLELSNVGEVPISITPGTRICQLFLHDVRTSGNQSTITSAHAGKRKPSLGEVKDDDTSAKLAMANRRKRDR